MSGGSAVVADAGDVEARFVPDFALRTTAGMEWVRWGPAKGQRLVAGGWWIAAGELGVHKSEAGGAPGAGVKDEVSGALYVTSKPEEAFEGIVSILAAYHGENH